MNLKKKKGKETVPTLFREVFQHFARVHLVKVTVIVITFVSTFYQRENTETAYFWFSVRSSWCLMPMGVYISIFSC